MVQPRSRPLLRPMAKEHERQENLPDHLGRRRIAALRPRFGGGALQEDKTKTFHYTQIDARSDYFCFEAINVNVGGNSDSHNEGRQTGDVIDFFEINPSNRPNGVYHHCKCQQNRPDDCILTEECSNDGHCVDGGWVEIFSEGFESE